MGEYLFKILGEQASPFMVDLGESNGERFFWEFVNMLSTLGVILVVLLIIVWFLKRFNQTRLDQLNTNSSIKVLERRAISQKSVIYLVEIEGSALVFAESVNGITQLTQFELEDVKKTSFKQE